MVIGAGVIGCSIARELSRFDLKVLVLDRESDVCEGTSKANGGLVHAGYGNDPSSLKGKLSARGNRLMRDLTEELDVPYCEIGSLVLAFNDEDLKTLEKLMKWGKANAVPGIKIISREEVHKREPNTSPQARAALFCPATGILSPFELTVALAENAAQNGVSFLLNNEVVGFSLKGPTIQAVQTNHGIFPCRWVINSAGVYADTISHLAGDNHFKIKPRKGQAFILHKRARSLFWGIIFPPPSRVTKGVSLIPTIEGNVFVGSTAEEITDKTDLSTSKQGFDYLVSSVRKISPQFDPDTIISFFAGIRAASDRGDFIIEVAPKVTNLVNVAGIESPGLAAAPAIAEMVLEILKNEGPALKPNKRFIPRRERISRFSELTDEEKDRLIARQPDYGRIICRCELVTEGEIVQAIKRPIGAKTLDGIKRRTRAGTGPCQGGFCSPRVAEILSRELNVPIVSVTKKGGKSYFVTEKIPHRGDFQCVK